MESSAGAAFLASLRQGRKGGSGAVVTLRGQDGEVSVQKLVACTMSPVLNTAFTGPYAESSEFKVLDHCVATLDCALDFTLGADERTVDADNAMALLALADQLQLEPLRARCQRVLLDSLVTTNAVQLLEAAQLYGCKELVEAARAITCADSSVFGELLAQKQISSCRRADAVEQEKAAKSRILTAEAQLGVIENKRAHELEQVFRANSEAARKAAEEAGGAASSSGDGDYPHAGGEVLQVRPNAHKRFDWIWETATSWRSKKRKRDEVAAEGKEEARVFGSLMEAYAAAQPGSTIQLAKGRHLLSFEDENRVRKWGETEYNKSVCIVAADGVSRDECIVGVDPYVETTVPILSRRGSHTISARFPYYLGEVPILSRRSLHTTDGGHFSP
jgi:hypothetical protein